MNDTISLNIIIYIHFYIIFFSLQAQALKNAVAAAAAQTTTTSGCWHPCVRPEVPGTARTFATMRTQQPGSLPEYQVDPYALLEDDLRDVYGYIRNVSIFLCIK